MAYQGDWGMFVHIPRTHGSWTTKMLKKYMGAGAHIGAMHGLPVAEWGPVRTWTLIRDPAEWYRSIWAYSKKDWRVGGTDSEMWNVVAAMVSHCKNPVFSEFLKLVYRVYPGMCSWVYQQFTAPKTIQIPCSMKVMWMEAEFGIKISDEDKKSWKASKDLPELTVEDRQLAYLMDMNVTHRIRSIEEGLIPWR